MKWLKNLRLRNKIILTIAAVAVAVGGWFGYNYFTGNNESESEVLAEYIRTTTLSKTDIVQSIEATGTVESSNSTSVTSETSGTVETVEVSVGDYVNEGDVLVTLESESIYESIADEKEKLEEAIENASDKKDDSWNTYDAYGDDVDDQYDVLTAAYTAYLSAEDAYEEANDTISEYLSDFETAESTYTALYVELSEINKDIEAKEAEIETLEAELAELQAEGADTTDKQAEIDTANAELTDLETAYADKLIEVSDAETLMTTEENELSDLKSVIGYASIESDYNTALKEYENEQDTYDSLCEKEDEAYEIFSEYSSDYDDALEDTGDLDDYYEALEECTIVANETGVITSVSTTVGSHLSENSTVVTIEKTDELEIYVTLEEYDILDVETGMSVNITTDASEDEIEGIVTSVSTTASSKSSSSSFGATIKVTGDTTNLLIGMNANCEIILSETEGVFSVPIDAIETDENNESYVYVLLSGSTMDDAEFEMIAVETGEDNGYFVEIEGSDLENGLEIRSSAVLEESVSNTETEEGMLFGNLMQEASGDSAGQMGGDRSQGERPGAQ